jgi:hypothetical protein
MKVEPSVITDESQQAVLAYVTIVYGDDVGDVLNALHEIAARIAIAAGVEPETFADGVKHHWDRLVNAINADHAH